MLNAAVRRTSRGASRASSQHGVVLILALIVLVALTLAAVAMTRSVATSNAIAGNLAFQQAATLAADRGVEDAVAWLETTAVAPMDTTKCSGATNMLACDVATAGYRAARVDPGSSQDWLTFWKNIPAAQIKTLGDDSAKTGNSVAYVIHRMCQTTGDANTDANPCASSPLATGGTCQGGTTCTGGGGRGGSGGNVNAPKQTYYRITVMVSGPRNTQSMVQAMVAL